MIKDPSILYIYIYKMGVGKKKNIIILLNAEENIIWKTITLH